MSYQDCLTPNILGRHRGDVSLLPTSTITIRLMRKRTWVGLQHSAGWAPGQWTGEGIGLGQEGGRDYPYNCSSTKLTIQ